VFLEKYSSSIRKSLGGCGSPFNSGVSVIGHFNDLATPPISLHGKAHPLNTYIDPTIEFRKRMQLMNYYSSSQKYIPIEWFTVEISANRRMIPFPSGSCPSKLECVKTNSIEMAKIVDNYHIPAV